MIHDLDYAYIEVMVRFQMWDRKRAKKEFTIANKRFRNNIKKLAYVQFQKNLKGVWSLCFWRSEAWQAALRYREHMQVARGFYQAVKSCGWSGIEKSVGW